MTTRMGRLAVLVIAMLAGGFELRGDDANPPAATTATAADFSTPMAALRTGKLALRSGDVALMKRCYFTANAQEQKALDVIVDSLAAKLRFQQVCARRFGEDAAERVSPGFNYHIPADAREQIEGDRATLHNIGGPTPTTLRRVNGEWKFTYASVVDNNFRDLPPMPPPRLAKVFESLRQMYDTLCDDVAAGKFEFVEDAMNARSQRQQAMQKTIQEILNERD